MPVRFDNLQELFASIYLNPKQIPLDVALCTHHLCARYLGGVWQSIRPDQILIKAITGGTSNLLIMVRLPQGTKPQKSEPESALIRIYCNMDMYHLINESIIFTMLSERSLGPKLFGVFPGGRFEQFLSARSLHSHELSKFGLNKWLGALIARIHALNVPVSKDPLICEIMEGWIAKIESLGKNFAPKMKLDLLKTDRSKCPKEITCKVLSEELQIALRCLAKSNSPVVFCHNDLQEGNMLLHDKYNIDKGGDLEVDGDDEPLVLIDFEYANYNYRGFDFGNFACEHIIDYSNKEPPYYHVQPERMPSDDQLRELFNAYLDQIQTQKVCQNHDVTQMLCSERNSEIKQLILETRRFTAFSHLYYGTWAFSRAAESPIQFDYISYGLDRIALYYNYKHVMLEYLHQ